MYMCMKYKDCAQAFCIQKISELPTANLSDDIYIYIPGGAKKS